eukprot:1734523-Pyramimonas_sp.AAC.1
MLEADESFFKERGEGSESGRREGAPVRAPMRGDSAESDCRRCGAGSATRARMRYRVVRE